MKRRFFRQEGFEDRVELDWFDEVIINPSGVRVILVPARHYSNPMINWSLWGGYVISFPQEEGYLRVFLSGDTGYDLKTIEQIKEYGPFDVAIVGIGAFQVDMALSCSSAAHMNPEEAAKMVVEVGAKVAIPAHFGTVNLSDESQFDLADRFQNALRKEGFGGRIILPSIGQTFSF